MADIYLKIDGIPGEATDADHKDWIELLTLKHEVTQPASATASSAGGGTTARCEHGDYSVTHYTDKSSPKLGEFCSSGAHIKTAEIQMYRASGKSRVMYLDVKLGDVVISSWSIGSDGSFPTESFDLNYSTITWVYTQQDRTTGASLGQTTGGWDLTTHKPATP